jgi:sugar/nucleoside kinase (ribokinase family)
MSITVVGSVAFDSVTTPSGSYHRRLAGAGTYFALAASYFAPVRVIGVVGDDFGASEQAVFDVRGIDTQGIEHAEGKSFFWQGSYLENLNEAKTEITELNVFATFAPKIPEDYLDSEFLFLANIDPVLQKRVRQAFPKAKLVGGDTMNYWINDHRDNLLEVLKTLDVLLINDTETKLLSGLRNPIQAAHRVLELGPKILVVKHGEYGATVYFGTNTFGSTDFSGRGPLAPFRSPALPLAEVVDPTGAGDSFAGGFFGYLASQPEASPAAVKRAMFYGGVMGSFAVEKFATERLQSLTRDEIEERFRYFRHLTHLED